MSVYFGLKVGSGLQFAEFNPALFWLFLKLFHFHLSQNLRLFLIKKFLKKPKITKTKNLILTTKNQIENFVFYLIFLKSNKNV